MVLGIERVVLTSDVVAGKFYVAPSFGNFSSILQCVENPGAEREEDRLLALTFTNNGEEDIFIGGFPSDVLVELHTVKVRVDPPSVSGSNFTSGLRPRMLVVSGSEAILAAPTDNRGFAWAAVNLSKGQVHSSRSIGDWASFSRWSLVGFDGDEEIEIASFDTG